MTRITNELMYEVLKSIQADIAVMKGDLRELKEGQISLRTQIHSMHGDALRQEQV